MYTVPSSTIILRSDTGDSDSSVSEPIRTPSPSSDADEVDSDAEVKAILKKRAELDRQYQELLTARCVNRQADPHNESRSRREGGRIKNKWSAVKVTPSKKQTHTQAQEQFAVEKADATSPTPQKVKSWTERLRNKNHTAQIQAQREHGHSQPPKTTPTEGDAHDDKAMRTIHDLSTSRMERHFKWDGLSRQACIPSHLLASYPRTSEPEAISTADNKAVPTSSDQEGQEKMFKEGYKPTLHCITSPVAAAPTNDVHREDDSFTGIGASLANTHAPSKAEFHTHLPTLEGLSDDEKLYGKINLNGVDADADGMMYGPLTYDDLDKPAWSFDALGRSTPANSDDALSAATVTGSDKGEKCEQRMLEDFGRAHLCPRAAASTPAIDTPTAASDDQEVRKDQGCHDSDCWCQTKTSKCPHCKYGCSLCDEAPDGFLHDEPYTFERVYNVSHGTEVPGPSEVTEMTEHLKRGIATIFGTQASNAQVRTEENANSLQCCHCTTTFTTRSPVAYCPGCGQSSGLHTYHAASPTVAEFALHTTPERTVEKQATEPLTPPRPSNTTRPDISEDFLEQALLTLGLERYISVSMPTLQQHLNKSLDGPACRNEAINAFATISKHQNESGYWENRLRWNPALDKVPLSKGLEFDHTDCKINDVAYALCTSLADCQQRWEHIKSKKALSPPYETDKSDSESLTTSKGWDAEHDQRLMEMKTYPKHSWPAIARELGVDVKECKRRFKEIKPKGWKSKTKSRMKKEAKLKASARDAPVSEVDGFSRDADIVVHVSADGACTTSNPCGWRDCNLCAHNDNGGKDDWKPRYECGCRDGWCACGGWGGAPAPANVPEMCEQCGVSTAWCQCKPASASDKNNAQKTPSGTCFVDAWGNTVFRGAIDHVQKLYAVTYWATIESEGKQIHVPIDSKHVSGPEKIIANGGMRKVWEWIHDKGLDDKVGLQDAFDLAQAMHEGEDAEEVKTGKGDRKIESRLSHHTPNTNSWFGS